jgi:hypothetical protein
MSRFDLHVSERASRPVCGALQRLFSRDLHQVPALETERWRLSKALVNTALILASFGLGLASLLLYYDLLYRLLGSTSSSL